MPNENITHQRLQMSKFHEIEAEKVADVLVHTQDLRMQIGIFFGTANLTTIGIALSVQKAGAVILAAALLPIFMFLDAMARGAFAVSYYRFEQLRREYAPSDSSEWLSYFLPDPIGYEERLRAIADIPEREQRMRNLHRLGHETSSISGFWLPLICTAVEMILGLVLWLWLDWTLF